MYKSAYNDFACYLRTYVYVRTYVCIYVLCTNVHIGIIAHEYVHMRIWFMRKWVSVRLNLVGGLNLLLIHILYYLLLLTVGYC